VAGKVSPRVRPYRDITDFSCRDYVICLIYAEWAVLDRCASNYI
jgi:hypothetical protein